MMQVRTWFPGRPFVRVRKERFRALHREIEVPGQASPDVQLSRTEGDAEWHSVRVDAIPGFLEEDTRGLMVFAGELMMQSKGLAIGSPWGGSGCRLWCTFQAHRARHLRAWAQRPDGCTLSGRAHSQDGAMSGLRCGRRPLARGPGK